MPSKLTNLYVVIHYDDRDWWAPPKTVSARLPYANAMDELARLNAMAGPPDKYQVMMIECHQPGKK